MRDVHSDEVRAPALRLEGFKGEWETKLLGNLISLGNGRDYRHLSPGAVSLYGTGGLMGKVDDALSWDKDAVGIGRKGTIDQPYRLRAPFWTVDTLFYAIPSSGTHIGFLLGLLLRIDWRVYNQSSGLPSLTSVVINGIEVAAPKPDEQQHIGVLLSDVDALIEFSARRAHLLTSLKKTMLVKMFPQGTASTPEVRFEGFEGDWECEYLGTRAEVKSAARVHRHEWTTSGVPFFRASDVSAIANGISNPPAFISHELYENLVTRSGRLRKGDVLVVGGGSIGTPYVVPDDKPLYSKDADLLWVQSDRERLSPEYLAIFFRSPSFQQYLRSISHAGTISHYTIVQAKNTPIPLPSLPEQQAIGAYFRSLDALIEAEQKKLDTLRNLKSALLTRMFV